MSQERESIGTSLSIYPAGRVCYNSAQLSLTDFQYSLQLLSTRSMVSDNLLSAIPITIYQSIPTRNFTFLREDGGERFCGMCQ